MKEMPKKTMTRIVAINLDDRTDSEPEEWDDNSDNCSPNDLQMSSELSECSELDKSAADLEMDLIEEVLNEDNQRLDQIIGKLFVNSFIYWLIALFFSWISRQSKSDGWEWRPKDQRLP